jgi:uncharacterized membrane protein
MRFVEKGSSLQNLDQICIDFVYLLCYNAKWEGGINQKKGVGMESKAKLFGHPIHPMLVVLPLGLFIFSVVSDILFLTTGQAGFREAAFYNIAGGVIGGLLAAIFGTIDFMAIPEGTRAKSVAIWHMFGNLIVLFLFSVSWLIRLSADGDSVPYLAVGLSLIAIFLGTVTAWLGGELVDRLGVGVDPGAHLDAPSSLTGRSIRTDTPMPQGQHVPVTGSEKLEDEP